MKLTKAEMTRQVIIEKAAPIFNRKGYAGTSLSDLTTALSLTKGAIYGNFTNKDEIALAVLDFNMSLMTEKVSARVRPRRHACDKLIAFAEFYRDEFAFISSRGGCPLLNTAVDSDDGHPLLRARVRYHFGVWMDSLKRIITRGTERGEILPGTDSDQIATLFISMIEGGIMLANVTGDHSIMKMIVRKLSDDIIKPLRR